MCLVAFQKIFQKIFSSVWKRRKENTNLDTSHNPENTIAIRDRDLAGAISRRRDCDQRRDLAKVRSRSTLRSREGEIAIDGAISRTRDRGCRTGCREWIWNGGQGSTAKYISGNLFSGIWIFFFFLGFGLVWFE